MAATSTQGIRATLDDVLITAELARRPSRPADHAGENRALVGLADELAGSPDRVLPRLLEVVLELCRAESAGISIYEPGPGSQREPGDGPGNGLAAAPGDELEDDFGDAAGQVHWPVTAGAFAPYQDRRLPLGATPCGAAMARRTMLLVTRPERHFTALRVIAPAIAEGLMAPWRVRGHTAGTLWVLRHDPARQFDAEDARRLASLASFAAAAHRALRPSAHLPGAHLPGARAMESRQERRRIDELQHRTRNMLGVVRSLIRRGTEGAETVTEYAAHLEGRVGALARIQSGVAREPLGAIGIDLLLGEELLACAAQEGEQASLSGPEVRLRLKAAQTIGLAFHELATNSVKFGALAAPEGRIAVRWSVISRRGTPWLDLEWSETASGIPGRRPAKRGFGMELLERSLPYELEAETTVSFQPGRFGCTIGFTLDARIAEIC